MGAQCVTFSSQAFPRIQGVAASVTTTFVSHGKLPGTPKVDVISQPPPRMLNVGRLYIFR